MADQATDWIEWAGGECPVAPGTKITTRSRDGFQVTRVVDGEESEIEWRHLPDNFPQWDIIAYRVVPA